MWSDVIVLKDSNLLSACCYAYVLGYIDGRIILICDT